MTFMSAPFAPPGSKGVTSGLQGQTRGTLSVDDDVVAGGSAMAFGGSKQRGEINVTPLVDVVLVLLIIFLVAIPVAMRSLSVDTPTLEPGQATPREQVVLEVGRAALDGSGHIMSVRVDGTDINRVDLAERLHGRLASHHGAIVFVDFDASTRYADAVALIDLARGAGADQVTIRPHAKSGE
jgi:biopolymer transport protein TolR